VFVRLGRNHDALVEQLTNFLGRGAVAAARYDLVDGLELPTDRLDRDLISGEREPTRDDYLVGLFAALADGMLVGRGVPRPQRRRIVWAASRELPPDELERVIARARERGLSGSIQEVVGRVGARTAG